MAFRSKSAERVIEELGSLVERYDVQNISVVDNIFDMRYFKTLLPRIIESDLPPLSLFYEVKANLTHEQIRLLGAAGVRHVQPGIESLSDHVLDLMDKGTSWLQNVQMLKWCKEFGIKPEWNLLYGFPGEDATDYDNMLPIIDAIDFLDPPSGHGPIRLDRFSPYHADPGRHGMRNVRAMRPYDTLYPFDENTLMQVAYYFEFDYHDNRDPMSYVGALIERIRAWNRSGPVGSLWMIPLDGGRVVVVDRRAGQNLMTLEGWRADVYMACDRISSLSGLSRISGDVEPGELEAWLDDCVRRRIMVNEGTEVPRSGRAPTPSHVGGSERQASLSAGSPCLMSGWDGPWTTTSI
jgi:ribosomal peptide maturation radical SAM protein 1